MSSKSKISTKKVKRFIGMLLLLTVFAAVVIAASKRQSEEAISKVIITLKNQTNEEHFLRVDDVEALIKKQGVDIKNETIASIDVEEIENIVRTNPWVKDAEVYVDNKAHLNIEVEQRSPIARVFATKGTSFYLDKEAFEMPLSDRYAYSVPVFTNYLASTSDSVNEVMKQCIVKVSNVIFEDTFWNTQIAQVDIVGVNNFNCYTTLGAQVIKLGDTADLTNKLNNLLSFYHEVSNKIGWDRYEVLDVRFNGQVVASPSIGWIPPRDTALANVLVSAQKVAPTVSSKEVVKKEDVKKTVVTPPASIAKKETVTKVVKKAPAKKEVKLESKKPPEKKVEKAKDKAVAKAATKKKESGDKNKKEQKK